MAESDLRKSMEFLDSYNTDFAWQTKRGKTGNGYVRYPAPMQIETTSQATKEILQNPAFTNPETNKPYVTKRMLGNIREHSTLIFFF